MASNTDPQTLYTKATRAELAQLYDDAFRLYIRAAEGFLQLSRTQAEPRKTKAKKDAGKALERAERIKGIKGATSGSGSGGLRAVRLDFWSTEEQTYILRKSSLMNGLAVPLWEGSQSSNESTSQIQPNLSPDQLARGASWGVITSSVSSVHEQTSLEINAEDIIQHVVSDCSVCAAISVCVALQKRKSAPALKLSNTIVSEIRNPGIPDQISFSSSTSSERHDLKVLFNGAWRRGVTAIDSSLPVDDDGTIIGLSAYSADGKTLVKWPSLVEKSYMKLMGGYNFPGSNSSIDFYALTGWVPEHIEIRSSAFSREKTWARIAAGHMGGHCVLTLGTDDRVSTPTFSEWTLERWGRQLIGEHNYAVVDVREVDGERLFTILDSRIEKRLLTVHDNQTPPLNTTLEMTWDDICSIFEGVYVNWDPTLFRHRLEFHGIWKAKNTADDDISSNRHLRLTVQSSSKVNEDLWVLLTRHQVDTTRKSEYIALHVHDEDEDRMDIKSIAEKANFTNSVHVLVRTCIPEGSKALSILASYDGPSEEVGFTVSVYSSAAVSWDKTIPQPPFMHKETGTLTSKNAGGNCTYPTYMVNPQYHLRIHAEKQPVAATGGAARAGLKANVVLTCQTSRDIPINITAVWSQGERIMELAQKEVAASSGAYSYGFIRIDQQLPVGDYTVTVSAFEPRHMGAFTLRVESTHQFDLKPIPQEGAGMYHKVIRGAWDSQTAAGGPAFKRYMYNPIFEVDLQSVTQLRIRLQLLQPSHTTSLNITLFQASPNSKLIGKHVVTSGPYSDAISGVVTPEISLNPGKYLLLPSTYHPAVQAGFRMIIYSSVANVIVTSRSDDG